MSVASTLSQRDQNVIWHPYTQAKSSDPPIAIVRGEGAYLFDESGKRYIDAVSSWWVNLYGHSHPYITEKVSAQLLSLHHSMFAGFTHEPAVKLAEQLLTILPKNQSKIFYSDNGSTATEVAVKMAIQYWANKGITKKVTRKKIIAFEHGYHGDTFGAMSMSGRSGFTQAFDDYLFEVIHISITHPLVEFQQALKKHKDEIAAFIFEPLVLGAGGMLMYPAYILDIILTLCRENSVLTIADEVMTGFGRTGKYFAVDHLTEQPDMMCLSKGLTGGTMALGVTSCAEHVYDAFLSDDRSKTFFHGHSFTANPIACTAALASFDLLRKDECRESIQRISKQHKGFMGRNRNNPLFNHLRSKGTILAMDVVERGVVQETSYFNSLRDRLYIFFLGKGVILRPLGNTVYVMPPYCLSEEDLCYVYDVLESIEL